MAEFSAWYAETGWRADIAGKLSGEKIPPDFQPNGPDGKPLTSQRFTKLLQDSPTVPWRWNAAEHVAVAPGAKSFKGGVEYSHGGVSPQECVLPVIAITPAGGAIHSFSPKIASSKWKRQRCTVEISNPSPGLKVDARRHGRDPSSTVAASIKEVEPDGLVSLLVTDESLEGKPVTLVLLSPSNEPIAKADTTVGS